MRQCCGATPDTIFRHPLQTPSDTLRHLIPTPPHSDTLGVASTLASLCTWMVISGLVCNRQLVLPLQSLAIAAPTHHSRPLLLLLMHPLPLPLPLTPRDTFRRHICQCLSTIASPVPSQHKRPSLLTAADTHSSTNNTSTRTLITTNSRSTPPTHSGSGLNCQPMCIRYRNPPITISHSTTSQLTVVTNQ